LAAVHLDRPADEFAQYVKIDIGDAFHVETAFAGRMRAEPFEQSAMPVGEAAD